MKYDVDIFSNVLIVEVVASKFLDKSAFFFHDSRSATTPKPGLFLRYKNRNPFWPICSRTFQKMYKRRFLKFSSYFY